MELVMDIKFHLSFFPSPLVGEGGAPRSGVPGEGSVQASMIASRTPSVLLSTSFIPTRLASPAHRRSAAAPGLALHSRRRSVPVAPAPPGPHAAGSTYWHKVRPLPKAGSEFHVRRYGPDPARWF